MAWIWGWGGSTMATASLTDLAMIFTGVAYGPVAANFEPVAAAHRDGSQVGLVATSYLFPTSHYSYCWKSFEDKQTVWFSCALKTNTFGTWPNLVWFGFEGTDQLRIRVISNGELQVLRGDAGGTVVASSIPGLVSVNAWFHLTGKVKIDNAAGEVVLYLNGSSTPIVNATGLDTQNHASAALCDTVAFGIVYANPTQVYLCDLAIWSEVNTGDGWTGWMGDVSARAAPPIAMGTYADWARGGIDSGTDYGQVDEPDPNGDTDTLTATTAGEVTTFTYPSMLDLGISGREVVGLQLLQIARKPTSGSSELGARVRTGGLNFDQAGRVLPTVYTCVPHFLGVNPDTTALWTEAETDAAELGPLKTV